MFWSSSQAATCLPHTVESSQCPLNAERPAGQQRIPTFIAFGSTRQIMKPESTVSVADDLSYRPLISSSTYLATLLISGSAVFELLDFMLLSTF